MAKMPSMKRTSEMPIIVDMALVLARRLAYLSGVDAIAGG
jgi:hypothetical protein